jgi:hypothetical protein
MHVVGETCSVTCQDTHALKFKRMAHGYALLPAGGLPWAGPSSDSNLGDLGWGQQLQVRVESVSLQLHGQKHSQNSELLGSLCSQWVSRLKGEHSQA